MKSTLLYIFDTGNTILEWIFLFSVLIWGLMSFFGVLYLSRKIREENGDDPRTRLDQIYRNLLAILLVFATLQGIACWYVILGNPIVFLSLHYISLIGTSLVASWFVYSYSKNVRFDSVGVTRGLSISCLAGLPFVVWNWTTNPYDAWSVPIVSIVSNLVLLPFYIDYLRSIAQSPHSEVKLALFCEGFAIPLIVAGLTSAIPVILIPGVFLIIAGLPTSQFLERLLHWVQSKSKPRNNAPLITERRSGLTKKSMVDTKSILSRQNGFTLEKFQGTTNAPPFSLEEANRLAKEIYEKWSNAKISCQNPDLQEILLNIPSIHNESKNIASIRFRYDSLENIYRRDDFLQLQNELSHLDDEELRIRLIEFATHVAKHFSAGIREICNCLPARLRGFTHFSGEDGTRFELLLNIWNNESLYVNSNRVFRINPSQFASSLLSTQFGDISFYFSETEDVPDDYYVFANPGNLIENFLEENFESISLFQLGLNPPILLKWSNMWKFPDRQLILSEILFHEACHSPLSFWLPPSTNELFARLLHFSFRGYTPNFGYLVNGGEVEQDILSFFALFLSMESGEIDLNIEARNRIHSFVSFPDLPERELTILIKFLNALDTSVSAKSLYESIRFQKMELLRAYLIDFLSNLQLRRFGRILTRDTLETRYPSVELDVILGIFRDFIDMKGLCSDFLDSIERSYHHNLRKQIYSKIRNDWIKSLVTDFNELAPITNCTGSLSVMNPPLFSSGSDHPIEWAGSLDDPDNPLTSYLKVRFPESQNIVDDAKIRIAVKPWWVIFTNTQKLIRSLNKVSRSDFDNFTTVLIVALVNSAIELHDNYGLRGSTLGELRNALEDLLMWLADRQPIQTDEIHTLDVILSGFKDYISQEKPYPGLYAGLSNPEEIKQKYYSVHAPIVHWLYRLLIDGELDESPSPSVRDNNKALSESSIDFLEVFRTIRGKPLPAEFATVLKEFERWWDKILTSTAEINGISKKSLFDENGYPREYLPNEELD